MKLRKGSLDNIILIAGAICLVWILLLPKPGDTAWSYYDTLKHASTTLKGEMPFSDFAAEVVGFRALYNKTDPYPILGPAFKDLGIDWDVVDPPSHPPTSFLFAAPVAFLPWPVASAVWAWQMLCLIVLSYRFYGLSWKKSLGLTPLTLLWPPTSISLGQVTIVWMFGLALGYYFRKTQPFWSGVAIGIASATKYWAGLIMIIFLMKRKQAVVWGCTALWVLSLSIASALNSAAIPRYFEAAREASLRVIARTDNQSPLVVSYRHGGWVGVALIVLFFSLVVFVNRRFFYEWETFPSTRVWMLLSYFSVALLPTSYIYALMPLLPVIIFLLCERKIAATVPALCALLVPCIFVQGGDQSALPMASVSIFIGLAFMLDVLPFKILQRQWQLR